MQRALGNTSRSLNYLREWFELVEQASIHLQSSSIALTGLALCRFHRTQYFFEAPETLPPRPSDDLAPLYLQLLPQVLLSSLVGLLSKGRVSRH
jgi:hypothetical protein